MQHDRFAASFFKYVVFFAESTRSRRRGSHNLDPPRRGSGIGKNMSHILQGILSADHPPPIVARNPAPTEVMMPLTVFSADSSSFHGGVASASRVQIRVVGDEVARAVASTGPVLPTQVTGTHLHPVSVASSSNNNRGQSDGFMQHLTATEVILLILWLSHALSCSWLPLLLNAFVIVPGKRWKAHTQSVLGCQTRRPFGSFANLTKESDITLSTKLHKHSTSTTDLTLLPFLHYNISKPQCSVYRNMSPESWKSLHEHFSHSVVKLAICKINTKEMVDFGTGIVLCHTKQHVGIITTMSCSPKDGHRVFARFDSKDTGYYGARLVLEGTILSGLVVGLPPNHQKRFVNLSDASYYEPDVVKTEPLWGIGSFSNSSQPIMPHGSVSACNVVKTVYVKKSKKQLTFLHSCPIGDGLVGALIINRFHKIVGINITRTSQTGRLNYAIKFKELVIELAKLVDESEDYKGPFSDLVEIFKNRLFETYSSKKMKMNDGSSSSMTTK